MLQELTYDGVERIAFVLGDDSRDDSLLSTYQIAPRQGYRSLRKRGITDVRVIDLPESAVNSLQNK